MLAIGERAPVFEGKTDNGEPFRLEALRGQPLVLYFYPKAGTYGCTRESMDFAAHIGEFQAAGARVVGISVDTVEDQRGFSEKCHLPFPLVADADKSVARLYGVLGAFGYAKRVTFLLDSEGRVAAVHSSAMPSSHVNQMLESLRQAAKGPPGPAAERPR